MAYLDTYPDDLHDSLQPPSHPSSAGNLRSPFNFHSDTLDPLGQSSAAAIASAYTFGGSDLHADSPHANGAYSFGSRHSISPTASPSHHRISHAGQPTALDPHAQRLVSISSCRPLSGPAGTEVAIIITVHPHNPHRVRGFRVLFGPQVTQARVVHEERLTDGSERVELSAIAPADHLLGWFNGAAPAVSLLVQAMDEIGNVADWAEGGQYMYTAASPALKNLKRSGSPLMSSRSAPLSRQMTANFSDYGSDPRYTQAYPGQSSASPYAGPPPTSHTPITQWQDERETNHRRDNTAGSQNGTSGSSSSVALRHPPIDDPDPSQPFLTRTSQIPASTGGAPTTFSNKAQLTFEGDINTMAMGWTPDEWNSRRRLVQFWRRQDGNQIIASFAPMPFNEYTPNAISISCIFREDKNECYVTSVDTIYLLEALIAVRFSVEEKNRIRRNLEGFKPITISKSKSESEYFFKLIMGFPNPKPRNIEKDVKVFAWKSLANALKKIIAKYSAVYSSTGGAPPIEHTPSNNSNEDSDSVATPVRGVKKELPNTPAS